MTFGYKAAVWLSGLERHRERFAQLRRRVLVAQLSGASGTLASLGADGLEVQSEFAGLLGLAAPSITWHSSRDALVETVQLLALTCASLAKNALDVSLMMATEFGEVSEPFVRHRRASSTMSQKRNPISCELILAAARMVRQHAGLMLDAMVHDFERATGPWHLQWSAVPESFALTSGALAQATSMLSGLQVHPERMRANLDITRGLVVAEAVMMALAPVTGRQVAHDDRISAPLAEGAGQGPAAQEARRRRRGGRARRIQLCQHLQRGFHPRRRHASIHLCGAYRSVSRGPILICCGSDCYPSTTLLNQSEKLLFLSIVSSGTKRDASLIGSISIQVRLHCLGLVRAARWDKFKRGKFAMNTSYRAVMNSTTFLTLAAGLLASPALAQSSTPAEAADEAQEIVVTGSLIRGVDANTALPVTVINSESLDRAGITNTADAIRQAAADGAGSIGIGFTSGFSAGGSAVSLRNLGVSSTLVLVDGLRAANFPLSDDGHNSYVDLNSIPQVNVDRIEVLKDGASSLYGADAIGGVVNIITRKRFNGLMGGVEAGLSEEGDGEKYRARLLGGIGDYGSDGWNVYVGGEYERTGNITVSSRGFPFNTLDLSSIGGRDNNRADDTLTTPTTDAVVTRTTQTDLNNPLAGSVANATTPALFTSLTPLANCSYGTFSQNTSALSGTACAHNLTDEYIEIQPDQERYAFVARLSYRISDTIESYLQGSYSHNDVDINLVPRGIRQNQAFGGSPSTSTTNPGIVLPVWICPSGVNCADPATPGRTLNPNNPYAAAYANNPSQGAARIYYLFGDVKAGSVRTNEMYRISGGLSGSFADTWDWRVEAAYSRDDLELVQTGFANLNGLIKAINTGSYNFVNPSQNSQAVRDEVLPPITSLSNSTEFTVDASVSRPLFALPGGDAEIAVGGQYRKEKLTNRSANPNLDVPGLSTAQAFGNRDVWAGFFEINLPVLESLDVTGSGRYDDYSEGFSHFSPKVSARFEPIDEVALRGSYSEGFRAPTFAEADPRSSFSGFVGYNPGTASPDFAAAHAANASYYANYSIGRGYVGNPDIEPETSRSITLGAVVQPTSWFTFTADYFNVKKSNLIVTGPLSGAAIDAYYSVAGQSFPSAAAAAAAGCAQVAAVGAGYSCNVIDGADPFALNALPRLLVLNAPYVNASYDVTSGLQFTASANLPVTNEISLESRLDLQTTLKYNRHLDSGEVQRFVGTVGPADLSSGGGTPKWRGNWQNTLLFGDDLELTATTYYVGSMKGVATDQGNLDTSCAATLYKDANGGNSFCKIKTFVYVDLNASFRITDNVDVFAFIGNVGNAGAPLYANTLYTTQPNYLASWHMPGLIGRTFRAGANFRF